MAERGRQMAELLARQFAGEVDGYETLIGRLDQLDGFDHGRTTQEGPMTEALGKRGHMKKTTASRWFQ